MTITAATATESQSFEEQVRQNPQDPVLRLIWADFLEENGMPCAAICQRQYAKELVDGPTPELSYRSGSGGSYDWTD